MSFHPESSEMNTLWTKTDAHTAKNSNTKLCLILEEGVANADVLQTIIDEAVSVTKYGVFYHCL